MIKEIKRTLIEFNLYDRVKILEVKDSDYFIWDKHKKELISKENLKDCLNSEIILEKSINNNLDRTYVCIKCGERMRKDIKDIIKREKMMTKFEEYIIDKIRDVGKLCPDDLNIDCCLCDEVSTYPCKECWEYARKIVEEGE